MFTAHGRFHPKSDVDRFYTRMIVGGRGLMSVEYVKKSVTVCYT